MAEVDPEFSCRLNKARTKPKRMISASVTIFTTSGASVRAPTSANGFIACQMASAGSLVMPIKIFSGVWQLSPKLGILYSIN